MFNLDFDIILTNWLWKKIYVKFDTAPTINKIQLAKLIFKSQRKEIDVCIYCSKNKSLNEKKWPLFFYVYLVN